MIYVAFALCTVSSFVLGVVVTFETIARAAFYDGYETAVAEIRKLTERE